VIVATFTPEQNPCGTGGESVIMEMDACSGGRTSEPQLDINDDGLINADDLINIGTEEDPIWVAPTGIEKPGRLLPPAILIMDDIELKYFSTNVGTIVTQREKAVKIGVTHWIEK
jgi:type IV pilus assembly protein PilY1